MNTAEQGSAGNQECAVLMENAEKRFGQRTAVAGISLSIPCGSLCGFIGPNGSGKTTTLRMILRIVRPDQGRVVVLGAESGDCADNRVGYLPEERGLYRRMRVRELLRYYAALKGVRNPDPEISRWLLRLQADGWDQRRIDGLSKVRALFQHEADQVFRNRHAVDGEVNLRVSVGHRRHSHVELIQADVAGGKPCIGGARRGRPRRWRGGSHPRRGRGVHCTRTGVGDRRADGVTTASPAASGGAGEVVVS